MGVEYAYGILYDAVLCVLGVLLFLALLRAIIGPRIADRIVAINIAGTLTICAVCILALKLHEGYLVDVALIYSLLSFLVVVVLTKIFTGVYIERKHRREEKKDV